MEGTKPGRWVGMLNMKCPNCRKGNMYLNRSIFPLGHMMDMPEHCPVCGQKMELETGFYFGTGYVSYGLSVALFAVNFVWYKLLFGISFRDNSPFIYLAISITIVVLLQPWIMRMARVLYLYAFVRDSKDKATQ